MTHVPKAAALAVLIAAPAAAQDDRTLRMATIAPSLGQAITMATFANIVTDRLGDVTIEVAGGGAATLHQLEVGRGNLDFAMTSPVIYNLMAAGRAMYQNEADAARSAENVQLLMWFPYGQYHYAVRADSGIEVLDDIEGTTVFLGPQGGGAYNTAAAWIEATTGLVAGEDYEAISSNWQTGFQAFLDGTVDMYVNGCLDPCQQFLQVTETEEIRFIGPENHEGEAVDAFLGGFRYLAEVPAGVYDNQVNDGAVMSHDTAVGIAVRAGLDDDLVHRITEAFWANVGEITTEAPWAAALSLEAAVEQLGEIELHPGARRYYEEAGAL